MAPVLQNVNFSSHVWRQSYKMSTSDVNFYSNFGANLTKCQLLNISIHIGQYQYCGLLRYWQSNTSIHPVSYCPIWDEAVLIPSLTSHSGLAVTLARRTLFLRAFLDASLDVQIYGCVNMYTQHAVESFIHSRGHAHLHAHAHTYPVKCMQMCGV